MNYDNVLAQKVKEMKPSGIRRFFTLAAEKKDVISLSVGEPDFKTPEAAREAAIKLIAEGNTKYTANSGTKELREAISKYLTKFDLHYDAEEEMIITVGGSEAIDAAIRSLVNPGDEVIVVEPCFVCYAPMVELCHGIAVHLSTRMENGFALTADELRAAITDKTKLLILPFPSNPTGGIMTREQLEAIAEVLRGTDIMVLSDEIYGELTYGGKKHVSLASIEGMRERTLVVNGFSKAYAMTGWRLGYICGPKEIIGQLYKIHQYGIMCASTISQAAGLVALEECDESVVTMREEYDKRRRMVVDRLNAMGLTTFEPEGAFYVFPNITSSGLSSEEFCMQLLEKKSVAIVPGNAFGEAGEGHARISYSYSVEHLNTALDRIEEFLKELRG
ncbi:MAG: pyridoxal phosphate-dependent aminotransferase [Oscillospiraceae bacterium]|nr:pyridoxal phosphate-dependent aminotransferase [Oscillospiraceae bacterium]